MRLLGWRAGAARLARLGAALFVLGSGVCAIGALTTASSSSISTGALSIVRGSGVSTAQVRTAHTAFEKVISRVTTILDIRPVPLTVRLYATFATYSRAVSRVRGFPPQGTWDTSGPMVHGVLLLGPGTGRESHRLAHVYAELAFDHLTHRPGDSEPAPAWLYDGLAEVVADHIAPISCNLRGLELIPLRSLRSPQSWWHVRGSGAGPIEYCEAETAARRLVDRHGWAAFVSDLHHAASWKAFVLAFTR